MTSETMKFIVGMFILLFSAGMLASIWSLCVAASIGDRKDEEMEDEQ